MIEVRVKFFGPLKDIAATAEFPLHVSLPLTGEHAFQTLADKFPELRKWKSSVRLAVNLEYTTFEHELKDGDEICFIPPVSGG
jgi:molybdopterin converting factor subunit 1